MMKQIKFKQANYNIGGAGRQPQSAFIDKSTGVYVTCWRPTAIERLRMLLFGKVFVCIHTTSATLPPTAVMAAEKEVFGNQ